MPFHTEIIVDARCMMPIILHWLRQGKRPPGVEGAGPPHVSSLTPWRKTGITCYTSTGEARTEMLPGGSEAAAMTTRGGKNGARAEIDGGGNGRTGTSLHTEKQQLQKQND